MESRSYLGTLLLLILSLVTRTILTSCHLRISLDFGETDERLDKDIYRLFDIMDIIHNYIGLYSLIIYTGNFDLKPSLEQRAMERFAVPMYTVASNKGPLNHRYAKASNTVFTVLSGLDDPTLMALNDTQLSSSSHFFNFLYAPPRNVNQLLTTDEIRDFFNWCWQRDIILVFLHFRGESEFETWTYYYFSNVSILRIGEEGSFENVFRTHGYRLLVQVANDPPSVFWYNSAEQADVIRSGNVSLSGDLGILIMEFMRHINASMEILPVKEQQNSNYDIIEVASNRIVDMVANLAENHSLQFSPIVAESQICLLVPRRRTIPLGSYFHRAATPGSVLYPVGLAVIVLVIKYIAHRRRSLVDAFIDTIRFLLGVPLPGGHLERLPLADKILEVYCLLFVGILLNIFVSFLSSALTAGIYYPPITNVKSMRASGLRILTSDPTIKQAFEDNRMPRLLLDLVDVVDAETIFKQFVGLNDSNVYVTKTHNWQSFRLFQEHLQNQRFTVAGAELCSHKRHLRIPISPKSPLRYVFQAYFERILESGLQRKWLQMGFQKFRQVRGITELPRDTQNEFRPLTLSFYTDYIKFYIGGVLVSTLVLIIEVFYNRFHG